MGKHNEFGRKGEDLAAEYLVKQGYKIKYRNYRYLKAEIDIIAQKEEILAIIEVKSRSSDYFENVADTVTEKKIKLLLTAADHYVINQDLDVEVRFDIITVLKNKNGFEIEHLKNAFYHF
ncbi:YraN family protein [Spongiimicrobium sp. 3-5]|uniref:YraN family protein n=1 Tax=Spongiimicrobium sp. 3-5 TaxID=3332596 RepID=UPI00398126FF